MTDSSTPHAAVTIETVGVQSRIESIEVEDHDRAIDRARIVLDSADSMSAIVREQAKVSISIGWSDQNALIFEGVVVGVRSEASGTGQARVTVSAYDMSYRMKQNPKQNPAKDRSFISCKLSDALKTILADYSDIQAGDIKPDPDPVFTPKSPWNKVSGQSDWDFIQDAASKWKARTFVEVNDNQSKFYFVAEKNLLSGSPMGVLHYCPGGIGPLIKFDYKRIGGGAAPQTSVTVIDPATGQPVTKTVSPPADEAPLQIDLGADAATTKAAGIMAQASGQPVDSRPITVLPAQTSDPDRAEQAIQQDPTRVLGFSGNGLCRGTVMLRAKGKVTIMGLPPWVADDWYVHRVNHVYTRLISTDKHGKPADHSTFQTKFAVTR